MSAWEQDVKLTRGNVLQMRLGSSGITDDGVDNLASYLDKILKSAPGANANTIDLSDNSIGNKGVIALLDVLQRHQVQVKVLKLYKNRIGDEGGSRLVEFIRKQGEPVHELHLSHNLFTGLTLVSVCLACHHHEQQAYPYRGTNKEFIPAWIRLENNHIANPKLCLDLLQQETLARVCLAEDRNICGPWRCRHMDKKAKEVPEVHLFAIARGPTRQVGPGPDNENAVRERIRTFAPATKRDAGIGKMLSPSSKAMLSPSSKAMLSPSSKAMLSPCSKASPSITWSTIAKSAAAAGYPGPIPSALPDFRLARAAPEPSPLPPAKAEVEKKTKASGYAESCWTGSGRVFKGSRGDEVATSILHLIKPNEVQVTQRGSSCPVKKKRCVEAKDRAKQQHEAQVAIKPVKKDSLIEGKDRAKQWQEDEPEQEPKKHSPQDEFGDKYNPKYLCIFDFDPPGADQLRLRVGDMFLIYQRESGWAAGQKLDPEKQVPIGKAGWFPDAYTALAA